MNTPEGSVVTTHTSETLALKAYLDSCSGIISEVTFNTKESAEVYLAVVAKYKKETTIEQHEKNVAEVSQS